MQSGRVLEDPTTPGWYQCRGVMGQTALSETLWKRKTAQRKGDAAGQERVSTRSPSSHVGIANLAGDERLLSFYFHCAVNFLM